jgi:hypothetical protein
MPGPPAKHPSTRARRNTTTTKAKLKAPASAKVPPLPTGTKWCARVTAWWKRIWSSPMRGEWADADTDALYRGALLMQKLWSPGEGGLEVKDMKALAAEIRMIEAQFGLTPMARRTLQWELPDDEDKPEAAAKKASPRKRAAKKAPAPADPRHRFRVVS